MRKAIVLALGLTLLVGATAGPAAAHKRKKTVPPPATFEASGSIAVADPVNGWILGPSSLTAREFLAGCEMPKSQGFDGFVVELSEEISRVSANVILDWSQLAGGVYNLRMEFFDPSCSRTGNAGSYDGIGEDTEEGAFPAGTRYVLVSATYGALVDFTLTAVEIR